ncbi:NUDIX domain-containing protein [Kitasatospora sp. NPDC048194]|uniref:NUDIX domain-containing protein n=1 Tax=Kitasatospora sp. NPDC048194 TaxID=3364045 RepID=UPI00371930D6
MTSDFQSAEIMVTNSRGEILLQLRDDIEGICWPGYWMQPGGGREDGETPYETAARELEEETGLKAVALLPLDLVPLADDAQFARSRWFHMVWDGDESELVCGEGQDLRFWPMDALPEKIPSTLVEYVRQLRGHLLVGKPRVWAQIDRLHRTLKEATAGQRTDFLALQVLKVQEEAGEAAQALLGVLGANPRKGVSHTMADLQAELCDVIAAAMVALRATTPDAASVLADHVAGWDLESR